MSAGTAQRGFDDLARDQQRVFRTVLDAMARPGRISRLATKVAPPAPLQPVAASVLLALADFETSIWLDAVLSESAEVADYLRFHTGARITPACREADFALVAAPAHMPALTSFAQGTPEYPDRSTTLIIQVATLENAGWQFRGPGIVDNTRFRAAPLPADFPRQLADNRALFPRGVDMLFASSTDIAALPRSARIVEGG